MYYNDIMTLTRLIFHEIAPAGAAFHAVQTVFRNGRQTEVTPHCHDFYEWLLVRDGDAKHPINGVETWLRPNQLWLIRPDDEHGVELPGHGQIEFINIAFPCEVFEDFVRATALQETTLAVASSDVLLCLTMATDQSRSLWVDAIAAVRDFHYNPTRLAFGRFWNSAADAFMTHSVMGMREHPPWLRDTLNWAQHAAPDDLTLEGLVATSGVSFGHLSRTLKLCKGLTPTELITELRLQKAAFELASTEKAISEIAFDCGFNNLSYFYRRFQQLHKKSPRSYREGAKRSLPEQA